MSDFVAFFPAKEIVQPPKSFNHLQAIFSGPLHTNHLDTRLIYGAPVMLTQSSGQQPQFFVKKDGAGWIVIKGIIFDVRAKSSEANQINLEELLDYFLNEETDKFNNYEGTFALAAWDAQKRQGWAVNDQTSMLNLYYGEHNGGLYVATNALSLARALGLSLNPHSVQEFLARGSLLAPFSMFAGLQRVDIGEHICYSAQKITINTHWCGYEPETDYKNIREAAGHVSNLIVDRLQRYASHANPVLFDLTGGYDSRLLASAGQAANVKVNVTVNGPPELDDVYIARLVAQKMNWPMNYFNTPSFWTTKITPAIRQELTYRTNGELSFDKVYHHLFSRPLLANKFNLHLIGGGGEMLRYYPWSQEFFGIGRQRLANIDNVMDYRVLPEKNLPPAILFSHSWTHLLRARLHSHITQICCSHPKTRTTQQLDATYIWKMTSGHFSPYLSSVYNWLPSVSPLLAAGIVKAAVALPWKMRLTSQFQRHIIFNLSPAAAKIKTGYGGTAEPLKLNNLHLEARQFASRSKKLATKLERMLLKGVISKQLSPTEPAESSATVPFLTQEFKAFLNPENMFSRAMYNTDGLRRILGEDNKNWQTEAPLLLGLATIEQLCRELNFKPEEDFLLTSPLPTTDN